MKVFYEDKGHFYLVQSNYIRYGHNESICKITYMYFNVSFVEKISMFQEDTCRIM